MKAIEEIKGKTFSELESELENRAYERGYNLAKGETGTGWMAYSKGDIQEEPECGDIGKRAMRYASGWTETLQYSHVAMQSLLEIVKQYKGINPGSGGDWIFLLSAVHNGFELGYSDYIIEVEDMQTNKSYLGNRN